MSSPTEVVLHMELNAYENYGQMDCKADIVYTNQVGAWTFSVPSGKIKSATVVASIVADDGSESESAYSYKVWSGQCPYLSTSPPPHGVPFDSCFTDWIQITYPAEVTPGGSFTFTLDNTSSLPVTMGFIAVDWVELHIML